MRSTTRIVVTGIGLVSPLGNSLRESLAALTRGDSAIGSPTLFDATHLGGHGVAEVRNFNARDYFRSPKALKLCDRASKFAVAACAMALEDARWISPADSIGVVLGAGGCDLQIGDLARAIGHDPEGRAASDMPFFVDRIMSGLNPLWLLATLPNMTSAHVAIQIGALGPNSTVTSDWAAGVQAIGEAVDWIRAGEASAVLAGGTESAIMPLMFADLEQAGLLQHGAAVPDEGMRFVPAEGAAVFLLEDREAAIQRDAPIRAEICGHAATAPAGNGEGAHATAISSAMIHVLEEAGWSPADVDAVITASVPSAGHRATEETALDALLGASWRRAQTSFRARVGHALAASGPIDLALALGSAGAAGRRILCNSIGLFGQTAALGVTVEAPGATHGGQA
jgi:3-oxoacyl-[acyl-carrier-protein] synthase II